MSIKIKSIRVKIILYTILCLITFGIMSNLFIYKYLNNIVFNKVEHIVQMDIDSISGHVKQSLTDMRDLTILCSSDFNVINVMNYKDINTPKAKMDSVTVQGILTSYIKASSISNYVLKLAVINENGMLIQAITPPYIGNIHDYYNIIDSEVFKEFKSGQNNLFSKVYLSLTEKSVPSLQIVYPIYERNTIKINGYIYIEFDLKVLTDKLKLNGGINNLFLTTASDEKIFINNEKSLTLNSFFNHINEDKLKTYNYEGVTYLASRTDLGIAGYKLYSYVKLSDLNTEGKNILLIITFVVGGSLIIASISLIIISNSITLPIKKLIIKIQKISRNNDFSYDPNIEASAGEIGEIGKVVNEMSRNIQKLLEQTIEITNQKKNYEIAMLQSQVNPHFLYNTLNSIHWMAALQKNTGICQMTNSLTNLLKNMSKGFSDKISLQKEISLLEDYISIQSTRYMEIFEFINNIDESFYKYKIVKLTLQPLVENAIFHGIEPKGTYGTITLDATKHEDYVIISITDDGIGMTEEKIQNLLHNEISGHKASLSGIGVFNVNNRLKLIYGENYGLTIESVINQYTKVNVKIPIEEYDDENL